MLGGFNIVKHENHHYKYAHCETDNDMMVVNPDGVFIYTNWYGRTSRVRDLTTDGDFEGTYEGFGTFATIGNKLGFYSKEDTEE